MEVSSKILDCADVGTCGMLSVITALEFFQHYFAKMGHRNTSCDPHLHQVIEQPMLPISREASAARAATSKRRSRQCLISRVSGIQVDRKWGPSGEIQSVRVYDHSGRDRLAAKRFASVSIRGALRMSFFRMLGARNLRPCSKQPDQKNDQSIYRVLAVDRAPLPSPLARTHPGTQANSLWSKTVPTRRRREEYPLGNVSPRVR